ncbi:MAG TPA: hypothetical protein VHD55_01465 [Candidatus Paceibacterota bacterium]|nr:hypothetical protein [Candidatus Paceibacterota bacterium]
MFTQGIYVPHRESGPDRIWAGKPVLLCGALELSRTVEENLAQIRTQAIDMEAVRPFAGGKKRYAVEFLMLGQKAAFYGEDSLRRQIHKSRLAQCKGKTIALSLGSPGRVRVIARGVLESVEGEYVTVSRGILSRVNGHRISRTPKPEEPKRGRGDLFFKLRKVVDIYLPEPPAEAPA